MQSRVQVGIGSLALCSLFASCRSTAEDVTFKPFHSRIAQDGVATDILASSSHKDVSSSNNSRTDVTASSRDVNLSSSTLPFFDSSLDPQSPRPRYTPKKVDNLPDGPTLSLGYKSIPLDFSFSHNTHPDDQFLPNASVPGSAGRTTLDEPAGFFALGIGYNFPVSASSVLTTEGGFLAGSGNDRRQNANDSRPPEEGSFIYSEAALGLFGAVGIQKHVGNFYFGVDAQLAVVSIESGWERFGRQDSQDHDTQWVPSIGPRVGFRLGVVSIQADLQIGEELGFGVQMVFADPD